MRGDVAGAAGIAVFVPGAPEAGVLFVDGEGEVAQAFRKANSKVNARVSSAYNDNSDRARVVDGVVRATATTTTHPFPISCGGAIGDWGKAVEGFRELRCCGHYSEGRYEVD